MARPATTPEQMARADRLRLEIHRRCADLDVDLHRLARTADINRRTLDKYFEGSAAPPAPSFFLIASLASALDLSLDELLERVDNA